MIKSSANRPPRVGDVWLWKGLPWEQYTTTSLPTDGVTRRCVCPDGSKGTMWMSCWNDGDYTIISEGHLPSVSPVPSADVEWERFLPREARPRLGADHRKTIMSSPVGTIVACWDSGGSVRRINGDLTAEKLAGVGGYCASTAVIIRHADGRWADGYNENGPIEADRNAASRAGGTGRGEHVDCGDKHCGGPRNIYINEYRTRSGSPGRDNYWCSEKCRAHALLNRPCCATARVPAVPVEVPKPAPSACNWTCTPRDNVHGPRCPNSPVAPAPVQAPKSDTWRCLRERCASPRAPKSWANPVVCVVCDDIDARTRTDTYRTKPYVSTFTADTIPTRPVKVRPEYVSDNWRDGEWLPNRETP